MATLGTHEAEQVPTPTIFFNTFSTQPGSQLLLQSQGQVDGQAMSAHIQQQQAQHHHHSAFGGFQTFAAGMPYCSAAMGMKAGSVNGVAVPVQLPNGQIVYGQAADMTQFQMQCSQGQSQMPMMAPQPIVLALQPQIGYAAQQVGGMMTGHTAQGMPQIMAMPVGGIQHSGMQHVQGM